LIPTALIERSLNHLLRQSAGASEALRRHAGRSVRFNLGIAQFDFRIADDGYFSEAAIESADTVIRPTAALFARLPFFGREALRHAEYSGDPAVLQTLDRVFRQLEWDVEADLAPWIGNVVAHRLVSTARDTHAGILQSLGALGHNASEYVVEEAEMMARNVDVTRFNADVDKLTDDVARLASRLRILESLPPRS